MGIPGANNRQAGAIAAGSSGFARWRRNCMDAVRLGTTRLDGGVPKGWIIFKAKPITILSRS